MIEKTTRREAIKRTFATAATMGAIPATIGDALAAEGDGTDNTKQPAPLVVDTLLEGGTIVDGSGSPALVGDVALHGDRIVAVGQFVTPKASTRINCRGLIVAPGFCDAHTHCDRTVASPKTRKNRPYLLQGVSTVVTGNCGLGPSDVDAFLKGLDENPPGTNVAHLAGYGPIRQTAMNNAARRPTRKELASLRSETERAVRAGARGLSTGLAYEWNAHADVDELVEVCKVVADHGGLYASHIRDEEDKIIEALDEALTIGNRAQLPVHVSHFKVMGKPAWGLMSQAIARLKRARHEGQRVTADQYPYPASSTSLRKYLLPSNKIPGGNRNLKQRMAKDTELQKVLRNLVREQLARYPKIVFPAKNKTVRELVEERGEDLLDFAIANEGRSVVCHSMCEENVRLVMQCDFVATGSDGPVPHPRTYGTFPRKIRRYVVEEKVLSLEKAVRQSSGLVADIFGLSHRGYLRTGCHADVVVFDPEKFVDHATFTDYTRPATGVRYLFVNGQLTVEDSETTGLLAGRVLQRDGYSSGAS